MNNTKSSIIETKPKDEIILDTIPLDKTYSEETVLPEDRLYRYLHQPGEQHGDQKKRATDFIWSKYTYRLDQIVQEPSNRVLYYLQDGSDKAFMREELMDISEDTQVPPDWVKTITHHFCNPLAGYKKILLEEPEIKKISMFRQQV